jgi:NAD(P)-dependent dehydrogenase (short-subunit alcohol dehydrogenase family)
MAGDGAGGAVVETQRWRGGGPPAGVAGLEELRMELEGKVAVITGAAGGLGLALARRCAERGMRLVLADLDGPALAAAARQLPTAEAVTVAVDVTRGEQVEALAQLAYQRFGAVHLLFNNAGVGLVKPVAETTANDWRWVLGVNLWGVLHGIAAFLPRMQAQPEESRIVNTASAAGFLSDAGMAAYSVSKHAVVVVSETLHQELALGSSRVGVTVLCPAFFPTGIADSERVRPVELTDAAPVSAEAGLVQERLRHAVRAGRLSADDVAARALEGIVARQLYVFTHPRIRLAIEERMQRVLAGVVPPPPRQP